MPQFATKRSCACETKKKKITKYTNEGLLMLKCFLFVHSFAENVLNFRK